MQQDTAPQRVFLAIALAAMLAAADLGWAGNRPLFLELNASLGMAHPLFWSALTASGDTLVGLVLWLPLFLWRPRFFAVVLVALLPVGGVVHLLKYLVAMPRPPAVFDPSALVILGPVLKGGSFPSGHAATAFTLAGMLAMARCYRLFALALAWSVGVGFSRIAAGVHWPADVLVGAVVGFAGGALVYALLEGRRWPGSPRFRWIMQGLLAVMVVALAFHTVHDAVMDPWLVVIAGWGGGALLASLRPQPLPMPALLGAGLGGASVAFVLTHLDWHSLQAVARVPFSYLLIPLLALLLSYGLRAWRLRLQLEGLRGRPWLALRLTLLHNAFNNLLPFRSGELSLPWLLHRHRIATPALSVGLLGFMRLQDLAAIGFCLLWWVLDWSLPVRLAASLGLMLGLWCLPALLRRLAGWLPRRWRQLALQVAAGAPQGLCFWQTSALTLANWLCKLLGFAWLVGVLLRVSAAEAVSGVVGAEMTSVLPLHAPAGLGTWEAGLAAGVGLHGVPVAAALPVALTLHALVLATSLFSLMLLLPLPTRQGLPTAFRS